VEVGSKKGKEEADFGDNEENYPSSKSGGAKHTISRGK